MSIPFWQKFLQRFGKKCAACGISVSKSFEKKICAHFIWQLELLRELFQVLITSSYIKFSQFQSFKWLYRISERFQVSKRNFWEMDWYWREVPVYLRICTSSEFVISQTWTPMRFYKFRSVLPQIDKLSAVQGLFCLCAELNTSVIRPRRRKQESVTHPSLET